MEYITCCAELDMGIIGKQAADIEYTITDCKPEVLGVWLYNFCGSNFASDVSEKLTDAAHDLVHTLCRIDMQERNNERDFIARELMREAAWELQA